MEKAVTTDAVHANLTRSRSAQMNVVGVHPAYFDLVERWCSQVGDERLIAGRKAGSTNALTPCRRRSRHLGNATTQSRPSVIPGSGPEQVPGDATSAVRQHRLEPVATFCPYLWGWIHRLPPCKFGEDPMDRGRLCASGEVGWKRINVPGPSQQCRALEQKVDVVSTK